MTTVLSSPQSSHSHHQHHHITTITTTITSPPPLHHHHHNLHIPTTTLPPSPSHYHQHIAITTHLYIPSNTTTTFTFLPPPPFTLQVWQQDLPRNMLMYSHYVFDCGVQTWTKPLNCSSDTTLVCPVIIRCSSAFARSGAALAGSHYDR